MCAQRNKQNSCFAGSPKLRLLLHKFRAGGESSALAGAWANGESMLSTPALVGESLVGILYYNRLTLTD